MTRTGGGIFIITLEEIRGDGAVRTYIKAGNDALGVLGYTEHGFGHAAIVSRTAAAVLRRYHSSPRECELGRIAGYMHDIGNMVNRELHALTGATIAFRILDKMGMDPEEIAVVTGAIGNHDEGTGRAVNRVAAALILADKSDVRRSRVREPNTDAYRDNIHNRVNYAVIDSQLVIEEERDEVRLELRIDTVICPIIEYFEIFLTRMQMCNRACEYLGTSFSLVINDNVLL